jgi:hypothetical protein
LFQSSLIRTTMMRNADLVSQWPTNIAYRFLASSGLFYMQVSWI